MDTTTYTEKYPIGALVESTSAYGIWQVTRYVDKADHVEVMARRYIKSRNTFAKAETIIATYSI